MNSEDAGIENQPKRQQKHDRKRLPPQLAAPLSAEFEKALNHSLRRRILRVLHGSPVDLSPTEIAKTHLANESVSRVSYHVQVLLRCQTVRQTETKSVRGATQHFYVSTVADNPQVTATLAATETMDGDATDNGRPAGSG